MSEQTQTEGIPWTIGRLMTWTSSYLAGHGVDDARLSSEVLLAHAAECRRIDLYARFDHLLSKAQTVRFRELVRRAAAHEPIAYLVGQKEFFSLAFAVTPDVLIPRAETELLVEAVVDHCRQAGLAEPRLLDVGTGSGCIAIAILVQVPGARAVATDISPAVLAVARGNAERHKVFDRLTLVEADRLAIPPQVVPPGGFDLLVCNPPYIPAPAVAALDAAVRDFEPRVALTDGHDGLSFYRSIAAHGAGLLSTDGVVIIEAGDGQAQAAKAAMTETGAFVHRGTARDRIVGRDRALTFSRVRS